MNIIKSVPLVAPQCPVIHVVRSELYSCLMFDSLIRRNVKVEGFIS